MSDDNTRQEKTERRNALFARMEELHSKEDSDWSPSGEARTEYDASSTEIRDINDWFKREREMDDNRNFGDNPATRSVIDNLADRTTISKDESEARVLAANRGFAEFCAYGPAGVHDISEDDRMVNEIWLEGDFTERMGAQLAQQPSNRRRNGRGGQRAQSATDSATGGVIVPTLVRDQIAERMQKYDGVRQVARVLQSDNLTPFNWPAVDDTDRRGSSVPENDQVPEEDIEDFTEREFRYERITSGSVRIPETLLYGAQAGIDVAGLVIGLLGKRLGRRGAVLTSHGTNNIKGMVSELAGTANGMAPDAVGGISGRVRRLADGNDEQPGDVRQLIRLPFEIDSAYRSDGKIMGSDDTMYQLVSLLDGENRSYLMPMLNENAYGRIGPMDLVTNFQMDNWEASDMNLAYADGKNVLVVADFMELYTIVDFQGMNVQRYGRENYESGTKGQVIFFADQYCAGNLVDQYAGRVIQSSDA